MQSNNLMAHNIVTSRNPGRNSHSPLIPSSDKFIARPSTGGRRAIDQTIFFDLEELQRGLVDRGAVAVAGGEVGDQRAVVRLWPVGPLDVDARACSDSGAQGSVCCVAVADDVRVLVLGSVYEAEVGCCCCPADALWCGGIICIFVDEVAGVAEGLVSWLMLGSVLGD
jgi:hypothetical protein